MSFKINVDIDYDVYELRKGIKKAVMEYLKEDGLTLSVRIDFNEVDENE